MENARIVIADDEGDIRSLLRVICEMEGWTVQEASSGSEALELCLQDPPDILVIDHGMPGLFGIQVARELSEAGFSHPIVLFSALITKRLQTEADSLGVLTVSKTHATELVDLMRQLVSRKAAPRVPVRPNLEIEGA